MTIYTRQETPSPASQDAQPEPQPAMPADGGQEYREIAGGAQYVPAPKPPTLVELLPAEYQTTNPPLLYRMASVSDPTRPDGRIGESKVYRAHAFSCALFYKPISRCLVAWEER